MRDNTIDSCDKELDFALVDLGFCPGIAHLCTLCYLGEGTFASNCSSIEKLLC